MSVESDTADDHSSSGSSSGISSGSDSDTLGDAGVYTPLNVESAGNRTMSHRIHVERIQKYEESEHNLSSMGSETIRKTESANSRPKTQFLKNIELNASVSNSHSSLISVKSSGKSTNSPLYVDHLTLDDNEPQVGHLNDLPIREELLPTIPTRAVTITAGVRPIKETKSARMSISRSEKRYINQYLLQERLGRGCFGTVRKCKDITTGHTFAMKILNKKNLQMQLKYTWTENNKMTTSSAFESVQQEISIMKRLRHKNILNLIEIIYSDDVLYLILEYMPHGSLAEGNHIIQKIDCEKSDKLRLYMRDMVSGLAYLHSQRICHSDLKPENILIGDGVLKLADFGISRFLDHGQSKRVFQEKEGTLAFQAPECLHESNTKFSLYPTDIWALGVTLYQLRYGFLPFYHEQNEGLVKKIVNKPIQLPASEKDKDFIDLIHRLLHKDPSKRITIRELCDHPWITKGGEFAPLQSAYNILSPTEQGERVMTKLTKFSSAVNPRVELVKEVKPEGRVRAKTTRGDNFRGLISAPIVKKSGSISPCDLGTISETKAEESNLGAELMTKLQTQSFRGNQLFKASAQTKAENSLELDGFVSRDADITLGQLSRAITDRLPEPRNQWSHDTRDMFSVHNKTRNGAIRLGHKPITFQERKINTEDMKLPFGFEEVKEQKSRII